jgi:hypothetical protein
LAAYALTDGNGQYRLENIPSGRYFLAAGPATLPGQAGPPCFLKGRYSAYIAQPAYLPGVSDKAKSTLVTVSAGSATAPDLKLPPTPPGSGFKVSGRVIGAPLVPVGGLLVVRLANSNGLNGPCLWIQANIGPDGSFEFRNVPPCAYTATVMGNFGDFGRGAFPGVDTSTRVSVVDKDITGLFLGPGTRNGALPATESVGPSGRPTLLETRLGMIQRSPLTTVKDCGHVPKASAQAAVSCVEDALRAKAPFIASFEQRGIDSQIVIGLAGTAPDVVQFLFESNPSGSLFQSSRVSAPRDCANPKLTVTSGSVQVVCN